MARPTRAVINFDALRHNLAVARQAAPASRLMAVIKANAYGHGLERVAQALPGAQGFGVACLEEAMVIREAGINRPVTLLEGVFEADELLVASQENLTLTLHQPWQLEALAAVSLPQPVAVWLKVDTGMHRLGFEPEEVAACLQRLAAMPQVARVGLMSHLACADDRQDARNAAQIARFASLAAGLPNPKTLANSGGLLGWPDSHYDWVRPGLMLYGVSPYPDTHGGTLGLKPVMTLRTELIAVHEYPAGAEIGYGAAWRCPEPMRVGVAAVGYGDGYPRHAVNGTPVLVNGQSARLIGRVSMDMISLDLRGLPEARVGDEVVLWGNGLPVEQVARSAGTIAYELLCNVAPRVRIQQTGQAMGGQDGTELANVGC